MTPHALRAQNENLTKQRNVMAAGMGLLIIALIFVSLVAITKTAQTVVIPSTVDEYSIRKGRVPDNYVINMTRDVSNLLLNRHPHDTDYFKTNIMRLVEPRYHDAIEAKINQDEIENKYKSGERNWRPDMICVLLGKGIVSEAVGSLDTYVNDRRVESRRVVRRFTWRLDGMRLWLSDTTEVELQQSECLKQRNRGA